MIYGYARKSTSYEEQEESLPRQIRKITERAATRSGAFGGIESETRSAWKFEWRKRPAFMNVFAKLRKGDELIVENLERLDRGAFRVMGLLNELEQKKIILTILEPDLYPNGIPLGEPEGKIFIYTLGIRLTYDGAARSKARKREAKALKEAGEPYTAYPPLGFKWGEKPDGRSRFVDDFAAQEVMREVVRRYHGSWRGNPPEPLRHIAHDLLDSNRHLVAGYRGKSNLTKKATDTPPERLHRKLAKIVTHAGNGRTYIEFKGLKTAYAHYVNELLNDGTEFGKPISLYDEIDPQHAMELRWLQGEFSRLWGPVGFADPSKPPVLRPLK